MKPTAPPAALARDLPPGTPATRRRWAQRALVYLPDLVAWCIALLCAGLGAVLVGSLGGCGGGVGSEGTGSFSSTSFSSGTITGFGSIVVNGVHFDESAASVQDDDGQAVDRGQLALGMVVQVSAGDISTAADGRRTATALSVRADRALVGPAAAIDTAAGRLNVLGQVVQVAVDTVFDERIVGGLAGLGAGQLLAVYGYYDAGSARYNATRIALAGAGAAYLVSGPVAAVDGAQQFRLGNQAYLGSTAGLSAGSPVRLTPAAAPDSSGRWPVSSRRDDDRPPDDRAGADVDGVVVAVASASRFTVAGVVVDSSAAVVTGTVQVGARVSVRGALRSGVLVASEVRASAGDARGFELEGTPAQLDTGARRFVLRGVTVSYARADLVFKNGSAAGLVGYAGLLQVKGVLSADRTRLEATEIEFRR
jgi:hypothetical protein